MSNSLSKYSLISLNSRYSLSIHFFLLYLMMITYGVRLILLSRLINLILPQLIKHLSDKKFEGVQGLFKLLTSNYIWIFIFFSLLLFQIYISRKNSFIMVNPVNTVNGLMLLKRNWMRWNPIILGILLCYLEGRKLLGQSGFTRSSDILMEVWRGVKQGL